jgi:putative nucleotidyltransferase with HDIG domain
MIDKALLPTHDQLIARPAETPKGDLPSVRISLRVKITFPFLVLSLILAAGAAYVVTQIVFDTIEERFTNQLIEGGKLASEWMVREEDRLLDTLRLLSHTQGLAGALLEGDAETLRTLSFGIVVNNQEESVELIDAQGQLVMSMHHLPGGRIEEYEFSRGGTSLMAGSEFVQNVLAGRTDELGDKFAGYETENRGGHFYVAGPVFNEQGDFAGAVLVGKTLSSLTKEVREETLAQITLYDFEGKLVASTFFAGTDLDQDLASGVLSRQDAGSLRRDMEALRELSIGNIEYAEILGPWEVRGDADLGVMGISLSKAFLVTASNVTRVKVYLLVTAAFALVIFMGIQISNVITRPLLNLVDASKLVAHGDLAVQVPASSHDEVAILAQSFNQMVKSLQRSQEELLQAYDTTIEGWSMALDLRDKETEGHSQRVTELTLRLARAMGMSAEELLHVRRGALLHDIGKMGIPDGILLKPGPLTDEEWEIMQRHPQYSYEMLWPIEYLRPALDIPYCHHEKWDGSGYPRQLAGEEIPLAARIFAVVDVWDALRSDRPYRPAEPKEKVLEIIRADSGQHFDPRVVEVFVSMMAEGELYLAPGSKGARPDGG